MINNGSELVKQFEGNNVEIIIEENGELLFELYSTGMALGHIKKNTVNGKIYYQCRKDRVDDNVKNAEITPLVRNGLNYLTEENLYDLMLEMKTDKVKPFKKWITSDILPTIRKTGGYVNNDNAFIDTYLPYADDQTKMLFKSTLETVRKQNDLLKKKDEEIKVLAPKADYHDAVLNPSSYKKLITTTDVAKDLGLTANKLHNILNFHKVIFKHSGIWKPYADYSWLVPEFADYHITEFGQVMKWSEKGRQWIIDFVGKRENIKAKEKSDDMLF